MQNSRWYTPASFIAAGTDHSNTVYSLLGFLKNNNEQDNLEIIII